MRLRAASRALLALAALGLHAGDGPGAPGKPALAYLGTGLAEGGSAPEWLQAFQATLTEDLKLAGAFRFMEGAAGRQGPNGPELLLSTRVRPEVRRRVIVACCSPGRSWAPARPCPGWPIASPISSWAG